MPVALATLTNDGSHRPATGWVAVFAIEIVLYVVGAAEERHGARREAGLLARLVPFKIAPAAAA
jgi:hypothetical protein